MFLVFTRIGMVTKGFIDIVGGSVLGKVLLVVLLLCPLSGESHISLKKSNTSKVSGRGVYVGFSYIPTFGGVSDFKIGEAYDGGTRALLPYVRDDASGVVSTDYFDWLATDTKLTFGRSSVEALSGSVGITRKNTRVELEVGHERFPAHYQNKNGEYDSDTGLYLLAKDLAYDVVGDKKKLLTEKLLNVSRDDLVAFAAALERNEPETYQNLFTADPQGFGLLLILNDIGDPSKTLKGRVIWLKGGTMISRNPSGSGYKVWVFNCLKKGRSPYHDPKYGMRINSMAREIGDEVFFQRTYDKKLINLWLRGNGEIVKEHLEGDKLRDVHRDFWRESKTGEVDVTGFRLKMKGALAKFLAKTVEGGEVVEIENISTASLMLNTCYDVALGNRALVPYACVGLWKPLHCKKVVG